MALSQPLLNDSVNILCMYCRKNQQQQVTKWPFNYLQCYISITLFLVPYVYLPSQYEFNNPTQVFPLFINICSVSPSLGDLPLSCIPVIPDMIPNLCDYISISTHIEGIKSNIFIYVKRYIICPFECGLPPSECIFLAPSIHLHIFKQMNNILFM